MDLTALHNLKGRLLDTAILGTDAAVGDGRLQRAIEGFAASGDDPVPGASCFLSARCRRRMKAPVPDGRSTC